MISYEDLLSFSLSTFIQNQKQVKQVNESSIDQLMNTMKATDLLPVNKKRKPTLRFTQHHISY